MNLFKQFVSAAVRQVGRDGGKIISNKLYGNAHSSKISIVNENNVYASSKEILSYDKLGYSEGDVLLSDNKVPQLNTNRWLWIIFIVPIPIFGFIGSSIFAYKTFLKKFYQSSTPLVWKTLKIKDGRRSTGYREESILTRDNQKNEIYQVLIPQKNKVFSIVAIVISLITSTLYLIKFLSVI